jgi:hypothetical protein
LPGGGELVGWRKVAAGQFPNLGINAGFADTGMLDPVVAAYEIVRSSFIDLPRDPP